MIYVSTNRNIYPETLKYHKGHVYILQKNSKFISIIWHFKWPINMHLKINKQFSWSGKIWKLHQKVEKHFINLMSKYENLILSENCVISRIHNSTKSQFLLKNSSDFLKSSNNLQ